MSKEIFPSNIFTVHVRWVPCHHGMTHPQVVDGEESLPMWRADTNILNKPSRTANKEWPSSFGFGHGANNYSP
jgi:hypothetical protein